MEIDIGQGLSKYIAHISETPYGLQKSKITYRYLSTSPNHVWRLLHEINLTKINRVGTRSGGDMGETMNSSVTNIRQGETVNCNIEVKGIKVEKTLFDDCPFDI